MPITIRVKDAMDTKLASVDKATPVKQALQKMVDTQVGSILVTDGGRIVGVMTERDFIRRCALKGLDPDKTPVEKLMTTPLVTIEGDKPIGEALQLMLAKNIRRLYITEDGKIIGRVTQTELAEKTLDIFVAISSLQTGT
jgi:CBS domain-containing protein